MVKRSSASLLILALIVGACSSETAQDVEPTDTTQVAAPTELTDVRFVTFPGAMVSAIPLIAEGMGFFEDNGLDVQFVTSPTGPSDVAIIASGEADFVLKDPATIALTRTEPEEGSEGFTIMSVTGHLRLFNAALMCRDELGISGEYPQVISQLEGLSVGISAPGGQPHNYLFTTLRDAGVAIDSVDVVPTGGVATMTAALLAGSVDCIVGYQPIQQLVADEASIVVDYEAGEGPAIYQETVFSSIATTQEYIEENEGTVERVVEAIREAVRFASDPANAQEIAERVEVYFPGIERQMLVSSLEDMASVFGYALPRESVLKSLEVFNANLREPEGLDPVVVDYEDFVAPIGRVELEDEVGVFGG